MLALVFCNFLAMFALLSLYPCRVLSFETLSSTLHCNIFATKRPQYNACSIPQKVMLPQFPKIVQL